MILMIPYDCDGQLCENVNLQFDQFGMWAEEVTLEARPSNSVFDAVNPLACNVKILKILRHPFLGISVSSAIADAVQSTSAERSVKRNAMLVAS